MKDNKPKTSFMDRAKLLITEYHNAVDIQPPPPAYDPVKNHVETYDIDYEDDDPYGQDSWRGTQWHCIRCGGKLLQIEADNKVWGDLRSLMLRNGTPMYLCENEKCCHHGAALTLHMWPATPANILKGTWCKECYGNVKYTIDEVKAIAITRDGECLSNEYEGSHFLLLWRCGKNHIWKTTFNSINVQGTWCDECAREKRHLERNPDGRYI